MRRKGQPRLTFRAADGRRTEVLKGLRNKVEHGEEHSEF